MAGGREYVLVSVKPGAEDEPLFRSFLRSLPSDAKTLADSVGRRRATGERRHLTLIGADSFEGADTRYFTSSEDAALVDADSLSMEVRYTAEAGSSYVRNFSGDAERMLDLYGRIVHGAPSAVLYSVASLDVGGSLDALTREARYGEGRLLMPDFSSVELRTADGAYVIKKAFEP